MRLELRTGIPVEWYASLDSTMLEARRDPRPGRIVVADEQTAGMGRHGRVWHSPAGEGLYVSFVLAVEPKPVISLALGLAARKAVEGEAVGGGTVGMEVDLRWPNDLLIRERKVAGVLAQAEGSLTIAGIGINVSQRKFPEDLETPATSLTLQGIHLARTELLGRLAESVGHYVTLDPEEIVKEFTAASSYVDGRRVRAGKIEGVTCGLDAAGFLRVREDNGTEHTILNGGVRPVGTGHAPCLNA